MRLPELIVVRRVGDRRHVKNEVELHLIELLSPIQLRQIRRHKIALVAGEVLEIARSKIIDHRESGRGEFFLQSEGQIRTDKSSATGYDEVEWSFRGRHSRKIVKRSSKIHKDTLGLGQIVLESSDWLPDSRDSSLRAYQ